MADDDLPIGDPSDDAPDGVDPTITAFGMIEPIEIEDELERSFLDYSTPVIVSRTSETGSSRCTAGSSGACTTWATAPTVRS